MNKYHVIREFGSIFNSKDFPNERDDFNNIYLPNKSFVSLRNFIAENIDVNIEIDIAFSVHRKKGKDYIRVKNYVGVIETNEHTTIEILPKIYLENTKDEKKTTRKIFLRMLRHLKDSPFKSIDNAFLKTTRFPLLEIFIHTFLEELELLIKRGLRKHYVNHNENVKFLKGAFDFTKHLKYNMLHKERFFVNYDDFSVNIPQNRLIKSALVYLLKKTRSPQNKIRIHEYLAFLDEIEESRNINKDLTYIATQNRLFSHYSKVLKWTKIFLLGESFTNFKGKSLNKAILFPMERIFEDYIGTGFKKHYTSAEIILQEKKKALVDKHIGSPKFKLKPDIVLVSKENMVLDTKWKIIDQNKPRKNYLISSSDMYQLFAYGKKYKSEKITCPQLVLLYPKQELFIEPLDDFHYDDNLNLTVLPVDLNCTLSETITKLIALMSTTSNTSVQNILTQI